MPTVDPATVNFYFSSIFGTLFSVFPGIITRFCEYLSSLLKCMAVEEPDDAISQCRQIMAD